MKLFNDIPDLTTEQFRRFASLIYTKAGIHLKDNKITLLSNRLRKRLRALNMNDFDQYYDCVTHDATGQEMIRFLEVVSTNETYFWRTVQNFEMVREDILPELIKSFGGEALKFWSAACSTGEEPYNLAIELVEGMKKVGVFRFEILATDISQRVLEFAREGVYSGRKIERVPPQILKRYFLPVADRPENFIVRPDIRERVTFTMGNIFESTQPQQHCIFCRNVMIYFTREDQEKLANRLCQFLKPGGFLVIGHSESLHMMDTPFRARHFERGVAYQRPPA